MRLGHWLKQILLVCVFLFALTEQSTADSLSDAESARDAGNYANAEKLYRQQAEQGNVEAQWQLGEIYYFGEIYQPGQGNTADFKEAAKWYRLAAKQGKATFMHNGG